MFKCKVLDLERSFTTLILFADFKPKVDEMKPKASGSGMWKSINYLINLQLL